MKLFFKVLILICTLSLFCQKAPKAEMNTNEDFADFDLNLEKLEILPDGIISITARGTSKGKNIGFLIKISNKWNIKKLGDSGGNAYFGMGNFVHVGDETENFLDLLAQMYSVKRKVTKLKTIPVELAGLVDDPRQIQNQPVKMKFFFNSNSQNTYSEVFINVDKNRKIVEFHEKDQSYRQQLVDSIAGWQ